MFCITMNDLHNVELFFTSLQNDLYSVERFVLRWMIQSGMDDLYNVESFGLRWINEYRLFNECQVCLFEKIFNTNLWVDFLLI